MDDLGELVLMDDLGGLEEHVLMDLGDSLEESLVDPEEMDPELGIGDWGGISLDWDREARRDWHALSCL